MDAAINPYPHLCLTCGTRFSSLSWLSLHCTMVRGHIPNPFYCVQCGLSFPAQQAMLMHSISNQHRIAIQTRALFRAQQRTIAQFGNQILEQQMVSPEEPPSNQRAQMDGKVVENPASSDSKNIGKNPSPHICQKCSKTFKSAHSLLKHQNAALSHVDPVIPCPHDGCTCMFKATSCIAHHMESGSHGHTRHDVTDIVHKLDKDGLVSIHRRILGDESTTNGNRPTYTYSATEETFNGKHYQCPLCGKECKTLPGLNSHLNSAAHDRMEFKCWRCQRQFKLISALTQHIEANKCDPDIIARMVDRPMAHLVSKHPLTEANMVSVSSNKQRKVSSGPIGITYEMVERHIERLATNHPLPVAKLVPVSSKKRGGKVC